MKVTKKLLFETPSVNLTVATSLKEGGTSGISACCGRHALRGYYQINLIESHRLAFQAIHLPLTREAQYERHLSKSPPFNKGDTGGAAAPRHRPTDTPPYDIMVA